MNDEGKKARAIVSTIVKKSSDKTVIVMIERQLRHPIYGKYITRSGKLHVHDEANEGQVGDVVKIVACPRKSKTKAWRLVEILKRTATEVSADIPSEQNAEAET